jgi:hypothetical protein
MGFFAAKQMRKEPMRQAAVAFGGAVAWRFGLGLGGVAVAPKADIALVEIVVRQGCRQCVLGFVPVADRVDQRPPYFPLISQDFFACLSN